MRSSLLVILLGSSILVSGCSYLEESKAPQEKTSSRPTPTVESPPTRMKREGITLTWEVPSEPVDGFVLRYGTKASQLDKELKVKLTELKEEQDQVYGPVYRYTIPDVPKGVPLFAAIAAYKGDRLSDFGETLPARGE